MKVCYSKHDQLILQNVELVVIRLGACKARQSITVPKPVLHHKNIIDSLVYCVSTLQHTHTHTPAWLFHAHSLSFSHSITNFCASFCLQHANSWHFPIYIGYVCVYTFAAATRCCCSASVDISPRYLHFMGSCLIFIHSFNILCFYNFIYWRIFYCFRCLITRIQPTIHKDIRQTKRYIIIFFRSLSLSRHGNGVTNTRSLLRFASLLTR